MMLFERSFIAAIKAIALKQAKQTHNPRQNLTTR